MVPWGLTAVGSITAKEVLAAASLRCAWRASSRLQTMNISGANFASALKDSLSTKGRQEADEQATKLRQDSTKKLGARHSGENAPPNVDLLLDIHTDLGESIIWDERTQRIYFVDINSKKIYGCGEDGSDLFSIDCEEMVGTIALTTDPNLLLAAMHRSVFLVSVSQRKVGRVIATVPEDHGWEPPPSGLRFNDGKASPGGDFIVGRMSMGWRDGAPGRLYRLRWDNPQGGYFEELQGPEASILPNGLAWDQQRFYHADTGHRTIIEYPTDRDGIPLPSPSGESISGRVVVTVPESDGVGPDGMTISRDGHLWVAVPGDGKIHGGLICYDAKTGEEITRVKLPVSMPVCCTFGGAKLDTLYVTSRREKGVEKQPENWGGIFTVNLPGEFGMAPAYKVKIPT